MKKILLITVLAIFSISQVFSQNRDFDGLWSGEVTKLDSDDQTFRVTLFIKDNNVFGVTLDDDDELTIDRQFDVQVSKGYGEQLNFFWMNKGGVWTETQLFSLSWKSETELSIFHTRHVSNKSDEGDGNTDWGYFATGVLKTK